MLCSYSSPSPQSLRHHSVDDVSLTDGSKSIICTKHNIMGVACQTIKNNNWLSTDPCGRSRCHGYVLRLLTINHNFLISTSEIVSDPKKYGAAQPSLFLFLLQQYLYSVDSNLKLFRDRRKQHQSSSPLSSVFKCVQPVICSGQQFSYSIPGYKPHCGPGKRHKVWR